MTKNEIRKGFEETLRLFTDHDIKDDSTIEDMGLDSLDTVELIMQCEDKFKITLPDNVCDKHLGGNWNEATVDQYVDLINKQVTKRKESNDNN